MAPGAGRAGLPFRAAATLAQRLTGQVWTEVAWIGGATCMV